MFKSVLIANRGEIACRVIRTLKRLGVRSVAVYSEADRHARHVLDADVAVCVGPAAAKQSYLNAEAVLEAARSTGAEAVHPGYGFLSENTRFAEAAEAAGIAFIGPTSEQISKFGLKHTARALAKAAGVPLLPGSELLANLEEAQSEATRIGFPVMLKSSAGGGGIGMSLCRSAQELAAAYETVRRLSQNNFGDASVYLERFVERARHIEVQLFGDGRGDVIALGERDCSAQRRNQKVIEETPAPNLEPGLRAALHEAAVVLGRSVGYRSAGTVEFVFDAERREFYFLEVNTRLQVEHGVTEEVMGVDLVEWMIRTAAGEPPDLSAFRGRVPRGHSIQVRVYAEDPARDFKPSSGLLTEVKLPNARVDSWIERGTEVSPFYDPLLAKIIVHGENRERALEKLKGAIAETRIGGIETNLSYLAQLARDPVFVAGETITAHLKSVAFSTASIEVVVPGTFSIVVEYPGRLGYWDVGIPPSGPMDPLGLRLANRVVGNAEGAAGIELTMSGPTLRFATDALVALTGADMGATLDDVPVPQFAPISIKSGQILKLGASGGSGARAYLAVRGGLDVPEYLGSRTTFTLGGFGGHGGRVLRRGDILHVGGHAAPDDPRALPPELWPSLGRRWQLGVLYGPHGAPDFFTPRDIEMLFSTDWEVHYNSNRTGVRLIGPKPEWARPDGGEAGLHPSNIHDVAYAIGAIDFTGDMPILLGPDGPSLGGFVCPGVVATSELWKMGQLRPGDSVRFVPLAPEQAAALQLAQNRLVSQRTASAPAEPLVATVPSGAVAAELPESSERVRVVYRRAGDRYLLVEYGPLVLDLRLRFRVHSLMTWLKQSKLPGLVDLTPGVRSLQIHFDPHRVSAQHLLSALRTAEQELPGIDDVEVPTRTVHLPLSWDDPQTRLAIQKYTTSVRPDAPWAPSNIEFIRRINGLDSIEDVYKTVFGASYLVLGLGDVYLGAPVATPVDPRHRLVTTKYNPARTWTPENAVGIGGAYLCIYGMEGPGGYQFVGRTLQVYNRFRSTEKFVAGTPWLLRFFDQIRFYPVSAEELLEQREAFPYGKVDIRIDEGTFKLRDYEAFLKENQASIQSFKSQQQAAFEAERQRWIESGQLSFSSEAQGSAGGATDAADLPAGAEAVESHVPGSVWKLEVKAGERVKRGQTLLVVESMKMEIAVEAPSDGVVIELLVGEGRAVSPGQRVAVLKSEARA
ncbi:MAG TPA: urea carboxylase [Polyangiaceae bacterium]|nr:urea carboxylase [Polyangiaceae bacterium]